MAKGWVRISTVNDIPKAKKSRKNNFPSNIEKLDCEGLIKEGMDNYWKKQAEKDFLLDGFDNKRLKSKNLIRKAIRLKKEQQKKDK